MNLWLKILVMRFLRVHHSIRELGKCIAGPVQQSCSWRGKGLKEHWKILLQDCYAGLFVNKKGNFLKNYSAGAFIGYSSPQSCIGKVPNMPHKIFCYFDIRHCRWHAILNISYTLLLLSWFLRDEFLVFVSSYLAKNWFFYPIDLLWEVLGGGYNVLYVRKQHGIMESHLSKPSTCIHEAFWLVC